MQPETILLAEKSSALHPSPVWLSSSRKWQKKQMCALQNSRFFLAGAGEIRPVPQENLFIVEQASCLLLRMLQDLRLIATLDNICRTINEN